MWVLLNDAWLSIVADRGDPEKLLVRSRRSGDISRIFGVDESVDRTADYWYRAHLPRDQVSGAMARETERIEYDNFKDSVQDQELHDAYLDVWTTGFRLQRGGHIKGIARRHSFDNILPSVDGDIWPPLNCDSCGEEIDHAFHAPVIGQPPGMCDTCWEDMNGDNQEESEEEVEEAIDLCAPNGLGTGEQDAEQFEDCSGDQEIGEEDFDFCGNCGLHPAFCKCEEKESPVCSRCGLEGHNEAVCIHEPEDPLCNCPACR